MRTRQMAPLLLLLIGSVKTSRADDSRDAARTHYARGLELAGQGAFEAALQEFSEAYAVSPQFTVLYNIGQAEVALGRPIEAIGTFSEYLHDGQERVPR